ncbi:MAG: phosphate ABC transporter substrate-binding protein PstS [Candidatus Margulisiibacteriota bacterium]
MFKKLFSLVLGMMLLASVSQALTLTGAGATFPYPIYSKWISEYKKATGVEINYASIGSGGGIKQFTAGVVDFGASDAFMLDSELAAVKKEVLHIPTVMGAVAVVYNLNGIKELKLDPSALAQIFMGDIKKWNDPKIAEINPGANLPDENILVAHRSDGSGTTSIFTGYLAKVNTKWASGVGGGKAVSWPVGVGGKGNEGVTGVVKNNKNSIGYVELAYAEQNDLACALIKNKAGVFVSPTVDGVTAAADKGVSRIPSDFRGDILNMPGKTSYPISGLTWILVKKDMGNTEKAKALQNFLTWTMDKGQSYASALSYAPLPQSLKAKVQKSIDSMVTK